MLFSAQVRFRGVPGWVTVKVTPSRREADAAAMLAHAQIELCGRHQRAVRVVLTPG
jgi:hypothetical protein